MAKTMLRIDSRMLWLVAIPVHLPLTQRRRRPAHSISGRPHPHLVRRCLANQPPRFPARLPSGASTSSARISMSGSDHFLPVRLLHVTEEVYLTAIDAPKRPWYRLRYGPKEIRVIRDETGTTRDPT